MPVASPRGAATAFFDVRNMLCAPGGSFPSAFAEDERTGEGSPPEVRPSGPVGPRSGWWRPWWWCPGPRFGLHLRMPAAVPCWGGCVHGSHLRWFLGSASLPFGSLSVPATERGARCPASRRPRVAPLRDAGNAAEPLQPVDLPPLRRWPLRRGSSRTVSAEQKAHGSIGHRSGGNAGPVQRICTWRKTLRSSGCARRTVDVRLARGLARALDPSGDRSGEQRRGCNGERGSPTVNGLEVSLGASEQSDGLRGAEGSVRRASTKGEGATSVALHA
jgi:hypothetical protein